MNDSRLEVVRMVTGSQFHTQGAGDEKRRSVVFVADVGTVRWSSDEDLSDLSRTY